MSRPHALFLLALFSMLLHLPFLARPIHGDEVNYLDTAARVFDHPLTPTNFEFIFQGMRVDMAGHPHPPVNAWLLAMVWGLCGHVSVLVFHSVYLIFSVAIGWSAYYLAARYTTQPFWAALLVIASPVVLVSGNTLETDSVALALLLSGGAFFLYERWVPAAILLTLAGFTALQTFAVIGILLLHYALRKRWPPVAAWLTAAMPFLALGAWQVFQYQAIGRLPAAKLAGYMLFPAFSTIAIKLKSPLALLQHLGVLVVVAPFRTKLRQWIPAAAAGALVGYFVARDYPWWERAMLVVFVMLGVETVIWIANRWRAQPFLVLWCLAYFLFACWAFFAGSAGYLMPIAVPLATLFVWHNEAHPWRIRATLIAGLVLGLNLCFADWEMARIYPEVPTPAVKPFLVNGEWGFRYYMTRAGGEMIEPSTPVRAGESIVRSDLSLGADYRSPAEAVAAPVETRDLRVRTPLRLIDRFAHSGFSSVGFGLLPFSFSRRPLDRITYFVESPFLDVPDWTPTRIDDHLVFLSTSNAPVTASVNPEWKTCKASLFAAGRGEVVFTWPGSESLDVKVDGKFVNPIAFRPSGSTIEFLITADPGVRAGWQDLVCY